MGNSPTWKHDCTKCKFLGQTIGGGKIHDLYVCVNKSDASLIARYGDDGPDYYSMPAHLVSPGYAHAELFVAKALYEESLNVPEWSGYPDPNDPDNYWIDDKTGERRKAP